MTAAGDSTVLKKQMHLLRNKPVDDNREAIASTDLLQDFKK